MTEFELGWVVGFLEGEGTFSNSGRTRSSANIQAWQVQREPLDRLARYTGISRVRGPYPGRRPADSPYYVWSPHAEEAARLMRDLAPHMSPQRQLQIGKALARHDARPRRDYQAWSKHVNDIQRAAGNPGQKKSRRRLHVVNGPSKEVTP